MITVNDAIKMGKAVCDAARRVSETTDFTDKVAKHAGRGTCIWAMDNLWFDVLPLAVRAKLDNNREAFYQKCGWPD